MKNLYFQKTLSKAYYLAFFLLLLLIMSTNRIAAQCEDNADVVPVEYLALGQMVFFYESDYNPQVEWNLTSPSGIVYTLNSSSPLTLVFDFSEEGFYQVCAIASYQNPECTQTICKNIPLDFIDPYCQLENHDLDFTYNSNGLQVTVQSNFTPQPPEVTNDPTTYVYNWLVYDEETQNITGYGPNETITFSSCGEYIICHEVGNSNCDSDEICNPVTIKPPKPVISDMEFGYACNATGLTFKTTNAYTGQSRQFRYKENGTNIYTATTNVANGNIFVTGLKKCTLYDVQFRVKCNGVWSAYSSAKRVWTRAARPLTSEIDAQLFCTSGYLYCFSHSGDKKLFRYKKAVNGSWSNWVGPDSSTTGHFASISGLDHNTLYKYQVVVLCGTAGKYSCPKEGTFTTLPSNTCKTSDPSLKHLNSFNVYPNPTIDLININLDANEKAEIVRIYNLQGSLVKEWDTQNIEGTSFQLDISELNKGMYMLRINETHIKKITKL